MALIDHAEYGSSRHDVASLHVALDRHAEAEPLVGALAAHEKELCPERRRMEGVA